MLCIIVFSATATITSIVSLKVYSEKDLERDDATKKLASNVPWNETGTARKKVATLPLFNGWILWCFICLNEYYDGKHEIDYFNLIAKCAKTRNFSTLVATSNNFVSYEMFIFHHNLFIAWFGWSRHSYNTDCFMWVWSILKYTVIFYRTEHALSHTIEHCSGMLEGHAPKNVRTCVRILTTVSLSVRYELVFGRDRKRIKRRK